MAKKIRTQEEESLILTGQYRPIEIAKKFGRNIKLVDSWFRTLGIKTPKKYIPHNNVDHDFFKKHTKESAYFAGFLAADGCVSRKKNFSTSISITLSLKDESYLRSLSSLIDSNYTVKIYDNRKEPKCRFAMHSYIIYEDLNKFYSITERKSLTLKFPDPFPNKFHKDFIRGYFDGDGCVRMCQSKKSPNKNLVFEIAGTYDFLTVIKNLFHQDCACSYGSIYKSGNIHVLSVSGTKAALMFGKWLYDDCSNLYMKRKYAIYQEYLKDYGYLATASRYCNTEKSGKNHPLYGTKRTDAAKAIISAGCKKYWADPSHRNRARLSHMGQVPHNVGKTLVNNGLINKYIKQEELSKFLSDGWLKGQR